MKEATLKRSIKQAMTEILRENREAIRDLFAEVIEDQSLVNAIQAGERTRPVKREAVIRALVRRI